MSENIKISVIVPVYNVEKYLPKCLETIINQTFRDIEILCIDDGSTDNSLNILQDFSKKDNRIIIHQQNHKGACAARNFGIKVARGEYIQFLDSDDYFELNLLEELYKRAENFDADLVVCSSRKVDDEGNITESKNPNSPINLDLTPLEKPFNRDDFREDIFSLLTPVPWNKLYKKSLITENEIEFPPLRICEDVAFVHSCVASANKIVVFDSELINYRFNRAGSMADYRSKFTIDVVKSCLALKDFLIKKGLYETLKTAFVKAFINHIRWEIALCSDEEYEKFLSEFKELMPIDWELFKSALRKEHITLDYLHKFIGDQKVLLWGASFWLQKLLSEEFEKNPNILGIIDKNEASWGSKCGKYPIYPPSAIKELKPDGVLMTIWSNHDQVYPRLKEEIKTKYSEVKLLPNIFD